MQSDIEIAQAARLLPITEIGQRLGIPAASLELYGNTKAKISLDYLKGLIGRPEGKLILVTAMSPTPAGEGKTTTTVGLGDALNRLKKKAVICLREPSLGPVFGMKGGAAGGGYAQVVPMEDINLHFTGDFGAIQLANNLLAALLDNHIHHGNELDLDPRRITWKRVLDMNDRALRETVISLGGYSNGMPRQDGFDIVVASEVMAIFCLATSLQDLKNRLGNIVVGYTKKNTPVTAKDLGAHGAMAVLLKDAFKPNLVQTLEHTPAFVHGGPFANIAHGCNSAIATQTALRLADYVVTEAGFGADLGAEKFIDIKCRKSGIKPAAAVVVATVRAIHYQGIENLVRHVTNVQDKFGIPCVVALNHFSSDSDEEIQQIQNQMKAHQTSVIVAKHWAEGGRGAEELAHEVISLCEIESKLKFVYEDSVPLWDKIRAVATQIYGATDISADSKVRAKIQKFQDTGYGKYPVCIAKTQYSFSTDPDLRGAPSGHVLSIREVRLSAGAEFLVVVCGDIMTMPGLPKAPSALKIDLDEYGKVVGLF